MIGSILIGLTAAMSVGLTRVIWTRFPEVNWVAPVFLLGIAVVAMLIQRYAIDRRPGYQGYDGLADVFIHIHSLSSPDSASRWGWRGLISTLLSLFGGTIGPEGGAVEFAHSTAIKLRSRSSHWFEQRRRTDAACALAAGIAAAFNAPLAAILIPVELGIGGKTLSAVMSALSAFLGVEVILYLAGVSSGGLDASGALYGFQITGWREWLCLLAVTVGAGVAGAGIIRFIRYSQESLLDLFQTQTWMRTLAGGILLFLVVFVYKSGHAQPWNLMEEVLWARKTGQEAWLLMGMKLLGISLVLSAFGTIGVFWSLFAIGSFFGFGVEYLLGFTGAGLPAAAGLAGGAAFWGAILGAPIAGGVIAYELTGNLLVLFPCLVAGLGARQVRMMLKTRALVDKDLEARGISLVDGRSASVLEAVLVRDAMVVDHETVHEQEPVSDLHTRLLNSRYPFLPVVNSQGIYLGLLTVDMIQESWQAQDPLTSHSPLSKLLEAKDLLYRAGVKSPTVKSTDRLSVTAGVFAEVPCAPVLGDDGRVLGLLFVYNVRLAYDREVARRALLLRQQAF